MTTEGDLDTLYQARVRDWARKVRNDARLVPADLTVSPTSPLCGSTLALDIRHDGRTVTALGYRARACTLGMASTAVVVAKAPGRSFAKIGEAGAQLAALLAGENVVFPDHWEELGMFTAARAFPTRHGSIMLPFDALAEAAGKLG